MILFSLAFYFTFWTLYFLEASLWALLPLGILLPQKLTLYMDNHHSHFEICCTTEEINREVVQIMNFVFLFNILFSLKVCNECRVPFFPFHILNQKVLILWSLISTGKLADQNSSLEWTSLGLFIFLKDAG